MVLPALRRRAGDVDRVRAACERVQKEERVSDVLLCPKCNGALRDLHPSFSHQCDRCEIEWNPADCINVSERDKHNESETANLRAEVARLTAELEVVSSELDRVQTESVDRRERLGEVLAELDRVFAKLQRMTEYASELTAERDRATERVGELAMEAVDHAESLALLQAWARECGMNDSPRQLVTRLRENRADLEEKRCDRIRFLEGARQETHAELARLRREETVDAILTTLGIRFTSDTYTGQLPFLLEGSEARRRVRAVLGVKEEQDHGK